MIRWAALFVALMATEAAAVECRDLSHEGNRYSLCEVAPAEEDLRLFLWDAAGQPYGTFKNVEDSLSDGKTLGFAMNAGMYHPDRRPVGHYVEDGLEEMRLLTGASDGNFGLLPNGVFCVGEDRAEVFETLDFATTRPDCRHASQSGPMLVIDGALHPRFLPDSTSKRIRNGVGTRDDGQRAVFVISNNEVTFHAFARLFRDVLQTPNALFFDGRISRLHAPALGRSDAGFPMGPIVGVVE